MLQTILIVDDSRLARMTLHRLLEKYGFKVYEADGVLDGERWISTNKIPDVVFMDVMMPEIDGFEGLRRLRESKETKDVPVIMYSGDISEEARTRARESGASGYLPKPADLNRLDHLINVLMQRKKAQIDALPPEKNPYLPKKEVNLGEEFSVYQPSKVMPPPAYKQNIEQVKEEVVKAEKEVVKAIGKTLSDVKERVHATKEEMDEAAEQFQKDGTSVAHQVDAAEDTSSQQSSVEVSSENKVKPSDKAEETHEDTHDSVTQEESQAQEEEHIPDVISQDKEAQRSEFEVSIPSFDSFSIPMPSGQAGEIENLKRRIEELEYRLSKGEGASGEEGELDAERQRRDLVYLQRQFTRLDTMVKWGMIIALLSCAISIASLVRQFL